MRVAPEILLSAKEREVLNNWSKGDCVCERVAMRARIILLAAQGMMNIDITKRLKIARATVQLWRQRFVLEGLPGIEIVTRKEKRPRTEYNRLMPQIINKTTRETPPHGKRWTLASMASEVHTSMSMVQKVWKENNLKPHLMKNPAASRKRTAKKKSPM